MRMSFYTTGRVVMMVALGLRTSDDAILRAAFLFVERKDRNPGFPIPRRATGSPPCAS